MIVSPGECESAYYVWVSCHVDLDCYVFALTIFHHKQHYYWTASFLYLDPISPLFVDYDLKALLSTIQGLESLYFSIGDPRTIITVRLHWYLGRYHLSTYTY